jgi:peptide deformylase
MTEQPKMIPLEHFEPPEHDLLLDVPDGEVKGIVFYPDSVLKEVSQSVPDDFSQESLDQLISDMAFTMYSLGGVGLSAIQIAIPLRVFICDIFANAPPQKGRPASQLLVAVNPEIGWTSSEKTRIEEGCLSFPGCKESIARPSVVGLRGKSRKGKPFAIRAGGFLGRVIQHEMDHLEGITFIERMEKMRKKFVSGKLKKFRSLVGEDGR